MATPKPPSLTPEPSPVVALSPSVRRHLGQNLRSLYADALSAPVSQRLEALISQLEKPQR